MWNTIFLIISSLVLKSIGVYFGMYISNRVGSEALGIFGLVMSVYLFMVTLASAGMNLACTRVVSEELATREFEWCQKSCWAVYFN